jgi:hypothetical protein
VNIKFNFLVWWSLTFALNLSVLAQANFEPVNKHSPLVDAPVFDAQGVPLEGSNYLAEVWGSASPESLTPLVLIDREKSREIVPFRTGGYFVQTSSSDALVVLTVQPGDWAWLQVRAWDARLGATFEEVAARGLGGYGESPLFYARGSNPFTANGALPGPLIGLRSFSLRPVTAVLFRAITRQNDQVLLEWDPGFNGYQLQQTSLIGQAWENLGERTTNLTATVKLDSPTRFFRIIGFLD